MMIPSVLYQSACRHHHDHSSLMIRFSFGRIIVFARSSDAFSLSLVLGNAKIIMLWHVSIITTATAATPAMTDCRHNRDDTTIAQSSLQHTTTTTTTAAATTTKVTIMNNLLDTIKSGFQDEPGGDHDSSSDEEDDPIDLEAAKKHKKTKKHPHPALAEQAPIDYMGHFYREMDNVRTTINEIGQATQAIKTLQEQALSATTAQQEETLSRKLQPILNASTQRAKHTQQLLTLLQEETTRLQEERETLSDSDLRVRHNLGTTITRKFVDEMKLYQSAQQEYKNAIQSKAKRQIIAIQPDATEEQVEQVMRAEGGREALMKQVVLNNQTVHTEIQSTFDKVAGKYQDVIKLEASVAELHQMFLDFALLTEQQGELLDSIEFSLSHANDHVEYANEETVKAMEYQSAVRKKQCWIIGIVSGVMLVLAFVIFG